MYTQEIADEICTRIALGETLREILVEDRMPSESAVYDWKQKNRGFQEAFVRARVEQHHAWADRLVHLAEDATKDWYVVDNPPRRFRKLDKGKVVLRFDRTNIDRAKLMIQTLQWLMANRKDSDYSPRQTITHEHKAYDGLTAEEIECELEAAAAQAGYRLVPLLKEVD